MKEQMPPAEAVAPRRPIALYAAIALLAVLTLPDWRFRGAVCVLMLALALKTWLATKQR